MISESGNKINWITKLQSVGIFFVVLGHCVPMPELDQNPSWVTWGNNLIYQFHMPLFMFLSGYLFILTNMKRDISYISFILKKAKRLLIPYLAISSIAFVFKCIFSQYALRPITFDIYHYMRGIFYPGENPIILFWFLPTLFLIFMLAPLAKKLLSSNNKIAIVIILLMLLLLHIFNPVRIKFLNLSGVAEFLIYFYAGCLFSFYYKERIKYRARMIVAISVLLLLLVGNEVMARNPNPALGLFMALMGIMFCIALAYILVELKWNITGYIDGYSYQIYLLSWFPQVFIRTIYNLEGIDYHLTVLLMLLAGLYIPVVFAKLIEKSFVPIRTVIGIK